MSARVRDMLSTIIRRAKLTRSEKEAFEDVWDRYHRYGRFASKQQAWIEGVYFKQKLDRPASTPPPPPRPKKTSSGTFLGVKAVKQSRVGYINHPSVRSTQMVTNMTMLQQLCPEIEPGSSQYRKIEAFFQKGGQVLKIKPVENDIQGVA